MAFTDRLAHAWNAFANPEGDRIQPTGASFSTSSSYGMRPDRSRMFMGNDKSILASVITRIGVDVASVEIVHARLDENDRFLEKIDSGLNNCLTVEANIDQGARHFRQDMAMRLMDKGVIAIVPIETDTDPRFNNVYDIKTMRVGEVTDWMPQHVRVKLFDDRTGMAKEIVLPKRMVAIVENPLFTVMNEPNSTLQRLMRKLAMLDSIDAQNASGKLDMIIQLPYTIKTETRRNEAEKRRADLERQVNGSQLGIGYIDGTEKITQLNRPVENNMLSQIEYLTKTLYGQLGVTEEVFLGTADEQTMLNYRSRTIEPILSAITEAIKRTFLTKTARSQKQSIEFFQDPFALVPVSAIAEIADKFTRNEILSSNEIRGVLGFKPAADPKADQLVNSNMPQADTGAAPVDPAAAAPAEPDPAEEDAAIDKIFNDLQDSVDKTFADNGTG